MTAKNIVRPEHKAKKSAVPNKDGWYPCSEGNPYTVLEYAFDSPMDLMASIAMEEIESEDALEQAETVLDMLRCIRAPRKKPDDWEFIVRVGRDCDFEDFRIVRVNTSTLGAGEYRTKYLNIAPREWYSSEGNTRVVKRFNEEFFGGKPTFDQMARFVLHAENFGT